MNLYKKLYFLGIGGIGMSAIARYFNSRGVEIHGYDKTETQLTKDLAAEGMKIHYQEDLKKIPKEIDMVIWTPAIPKDHKELEFFQNNGYSLKKRAEMLGIISRNQKCIAIAGTHGKTTTSTILTHILKIGGIDCTAFLGGISTNYNSNYVEGKSDWVVVEADEYDRSFLHLTPDVAVILSMDADHLDIYGNLEEMHETGFRAFIDNVKKNGTVLINKECIKYFNNKLIETYGIEKGDFRAENITVNKGGFEFDFNQQEANQIDKKLWMSFPGRHNVENTVVAISVALKLGVEMPKIYEALRTFKGIQRRFEFIIRNEDLVFVNDYAHHPTELKAAIGAAKELFPDKKITGVFQPHLFSRTQDFQDGFAEALDMLDECLLMEIYPARELPIEGVTSKIVFDKMKLEKKKIVKDDKVLELLKNRKIEVLLTLGAGDINFLVKPIKEMLTQKLN